jgi:hypothetical protein
VRGHDEGRLALLLQPDAAFRHDLRDGAGRWSAGDTFIPSAAQCLDLLSAGLLVVAP